MTTVSYMFFSSADAPNGYDLYSGPSGLLDVLDLCLVYGYSGHPSLGWTIEERSDTHRVYRASVGTQRKFLRVANVIDTNGSIHSVNVYDSITPETNRWFTPDLPSSASGNLANNWPFLKATTGTTYPPWVLFGDSSFFTLITSSTSAPNPTDNNVHFLFFGEVDGNTYLNLNPIFTGGGNGSHTRFIRNGAGISAGISSLHTNLDNPGILPQIAARQVLSSQDVINLDTTRDLHRNCWPCAFSHTITEAANTVNTPFSSRTLGDINLTNDGILPYCSLYFVSRPNSINERYGTQILAAHPHILVSGASAAESFFSNAALPLGSRLSETPHIMIDGTPYIPFIFGTTVGAADASFILIRAR